MEGNLITVVTFFENKKLKYKLEICNTLWIPNYKSIN